MTPRQWLRVGWLVFLADVVYWVWQIGHVNTESGLPEWHTVFNIVTVVGGSILLVALLLASYVGWRVKQARAEHSIVRVIPELA